MRNTRTQSNVHLTYVDKSMISFNWIVKLLLQIYDVTIFAIQPIAHDCVLLCFFFRCTLFGYLSLHSYFDSDF